MFRLTCKPQHVIHQTEKGAKNRLAHKLLEKTTKTPHVRILWPVVALPTGTLVYTTKQMISQITGVAAAILCVLVKFPATTN